MSGLLRKRAVRIRELFGPGHRTRSGAVCAFVNDRLDRAALATLEDGGTRLIALRSAGFNHVDLDAAAALGLAVVRVRERAADSPSACRGVIVRRT